jgi:hypothetical protein
LIWPKFNYLGIYLAEREAALSMMKRQDVSTIVIGGPWNTYFVDQGRHPDEDNPEQLFYYLQDDKDEKHPFRNSDGVDLALGELEQFLKSLAGGERVYLLLDNPGVKSYAPETFLEGSRLSKEGVKLAMQLEQSIAIDARYLELRQELLDIVDRAGVEVIDPVRRLSSEDTCMFAAEAGRPIYMDWHHYRPFFVESYADFIDITL